MGYSCRQSADKAHDVILRAVTDPAGSSNTWEFRGVRYFYETGREQRDGAITGTVWRFLADDSHVRRAGSVRIDPDGRLVRWPCIPADVRADVLRMYSAGEFSDVSIHRAALRELWDRKAKLLESARNSFRAACEHDGIPPKSSFVVFSDDNPRAAEYNATMLAVTALA